ncbi:alpha/beta fold hydrolase [Paenibacillus sp. N3.4]|uniref:acetylxylan esterase n=1 Tax=Paenibacillus sp. N3.4 TaxID=2603222 RepID=UPI0011C994DF|nr:alpha/beta fold hydrolase [Paenibacillus sp. N3.4]TXK81445.1 acetylxylan esterase [Paenibacillus sp. N3.4]
MNAVNKRISELHQYNAPLTAKEDLASYWESTLREFDGKPLNANRVKIDTPLAHIDAYKVSYHGFDNTPIHGWYLLPRFVKQEKLPCVVIFHGYTGGKGYPEDYSQWLLMGLAVFAIDVRGQGGETGNLLENSFGMTKGWVTQGILDKDSCYYKAITVDGLRAVDWVSEQPEIDSGKIALAGSSQGGGLALTTAALSSKAAVAVAGIPNMCHMDFGVMHSVSSLTEIADWLAIFPDKLDAVLSTLSYFDNLNLANRIRIPVLVSVGLKDPVCLPETVFATYNRIASTDKSIHVYPFEGHSVSGYHNRLSLDFIRQRLL